MRAINWVCSFIHSHIAQSSGVALDRYPFSIAQGLAKVNPHQQGKRDPSSVNWDSFIHSFSEL